MINLSLKSSVKDYGDTNFITGFRAIAAVAVVLIHSGGAELRGINEFTNNLVDFCRNGVFIFFVISGFSVVSSYNTYPDFYTYCKLRFFRIAPLYYFVIILTCLTGLNSDYWLTELNTKIDHYNLIMHILFVSFLDYRITNTIIGVEWSISIEMFWYIAIPLLNKILYSNASIIFSVLSAFIYYAVVKSVFLGLPIQNNGLVFQWSIFPYLVSFVLGVAAYKIRKSLHNKAKLSFLISDTILIIAILLISLFSYKPQSIRFFYDEFIATSLITFAIIIYGNSRSLLYKIFFVNPISMYIGTISYSIYLIHFPIIKLIDKFQNPSNLTLKFIEVIIATAIISTITFLTVENSGLYLYKKMLKYQKNTKDH